VIQLSASTKVDYVLDARISAKEDAELRDLLSTCFVGPNDHVFKEHRHFVLVPQHRFLLRDDQGIIRGNIAVHDLTLGSTAGDLRVAGVAEVAVHPALQGQGLAKRMLAAVDLWAAAEAFPFAMLFGKPEIYGSAGYRLCGNQFRCLDKKTGESWEGPLDSAQYKPLAGGSWPQGVVDLRGPTF
jgi:predicted N-acetyltransferase YhbS